MTTDAPALPSHELKFRAMGTDAHLVVVGGDESLLRRGEARVRELEQRWSRFIESSELSTLNRHPGRPAIVSPDTFELVSRAVAAWQMTGGRFDPTVGVALDALGYDRDFADVARTIAPAAAGVAVPGPEHIDLAAAIHAVTLPPGVTLDPGGIGKGLAADLVAGLLIAAGAGGALVNLGGDLRAIGRPPTADGWVITVQDPLHLDRELLRLAVPEGAVASSSRLERRWRTETGVAHHLIDPHTGRPMQTDVVGVTVVAGEAWWAEALTKALFLTGPAGLEELSDIHAVIVMADGARYATPDLRATLR